MVAITGNRDEYLERFSDFSERNVLKFLIGDADNPGSMLSSLHLARENARTMRDYLPREVYELVNSTEGVDYTQVVKFDLLVQEGLAASRTPWASGTRAAPPIGRAWCPGSSRPRMCTPGSRG